MRRTLTQREQAILAAIEAGPYAVSLAGQLARVVLVAHCPSCEMALPADHHCEADLRTSIEWTPTGGAQ